MSLSIAQLDQLLDQLENLAARLDSSGKPAETVLTADDPLVELAENCDFMLPSPLTVTSLRQTAQRKIKNVLMLLDRAKQNQEIPPDFQLAADNEDTFARPTGST